ncbi:hypothetical protein M1563_04040 [Patescibacteria group bacterium]|nr:hypothetical protein [Patescibacteria group bacterium]MCL5409499.1 hypothetical protein [Patescibacteria group bacterium]
MKAEKDSHYSPKKSDPPISEDMRRFLESQGRKSEIKAIVDAAREVKIPETELKLQEELESEIREVIESARQVGLASYSREDAIKALLQEREHQQ